MSVSSSHINVYTDGGSRGNPGPAAYGYIIEKENGEVLAQGNRYIGIATNNQAEYQGIVAALEKVKEMSLTQPLTCFLDSELVVKQVNGLYRMKNQDLKPWLERIYTLVHSMDASVVFKHIPREKNHDADRLVNLALDGRENEDSNGK